MTGRRCPVPPGNEDGVSWRGCSPSASLPRQPMPRRVLDLSPLRSGTALLQPGLSSRSSPSTAPLRQPSPPAKPRRTKRPSRPAARLSQTPCANKCDGSRFRFDLLAGQYANVGCEISAGRYPSGLRCRFCPAAGLAGVAEAVGEAPSALSSLDWVRPERSFRRSVPQNPAIRMLNLDD
jgi:hypothetical protein